MWIAFTLSCVSGSLDLNDIPDPGDPTPEPALGLVVLPVFDPVLGGPLELSAEQNAAGVLTVTVLDPEGAVVRSWADQGAVEWDGTDEAGLPQPVGTYLVRAELAQEAGGVLLAEQPTTLVRVGVNGVWAEDDSGATAERLELYWHVDKALQDPDAPIAALNALEDAEGAALDLPAVSKNLGNATATLGQPTAWTWDSRPILTLTLGRSETHAGTGLEFAEVGLRVEGWTVQSGTPLEEGGAVVIQRDQPLLDGVGVVEQALNLEFTFTDDEGVVRSLGQQRLPLRFYATLGPDTFTASGDRYAPWVAALDPALRGIQGAEPEHDAVVGALVAWIFEDLSLEYDTRYGASAYVSYEGEWTDAHFRFTSFLERRYGDTINCTDAASILLTYANMLGAEQYYRIVLENFALNEILAIGGDDFTSCPFGSGRCSFSYHAITSDAEGGRIWDATLAEDGDSDPGEAPHDLLLVQGIPEDEYLWRLDRSGRAGTHYLAQGTLQ